MPGTVRSPVRGSGSTALDSPATGEKTASLIHPTLAVAPITPALGVVMQNITPQVTHE
ncbi:hypothetical protein GCM10027089_33500 [Nocardia thraciensis]